MNGQEFYELALELSAGSRPAELRSATSRAYYGAFHKASEMLGSFGIALPDGPECHVKVRHILDQSPDNDVKTASRKLSSLRTSRNDADYDLSKLQSENSKTVAVHVKTAREIMDCIDLCFPGKSKDGIRDKLRQYARDVLRLIVS